MQRSVVVTLGITGAATLYLLWVRFRKQNIKGPAQWPIIGSILDVLPYTNKNQLHKMLLDFSEKYGPIFQLSNGKQTITFVSDAAEVKQILSMGDVFHRGSRFEEIANGSLHGGLFTFMTGETWYRHRKLLQPAFGPSHLHQVVLVTDEKINETIRYWEAKIAKEGYAIEDVYTEMGNITLDVM